MVQQRLTFTLMFIQMVCFVHMDDDFAQVMQRHCRVPGLKDHSFTLSDCKKKLHTATKVKDMNGSCTCTKVLYATVSVFITIYM